MLMTYETMDSYLKPKGKLAFVITQSVFKTAGAGQGFRRFVLGSGTPIRPLHVDDLSSFQPFEGATNRTAVVVLQKGLEVRYPVDYTLWQKTVTGKRIGYDSELSEVETQTRRVWMKAEPVKAADPTSPWLTARPKALSALRKVLGRSDYRAHEGVNTGGANGVFWLEVLGKRPDGLLIVRNLTEGAKRKVEQVTTVLEPDLVYPLLRGRDVKRWRATPSAYILMVQDPKTRRGIPEEVIQEKYPHTWAYLKRFEPILRQRAAFHRYFTRTSQGKVVETGPFYSMFNVGDYTFSPYKVVWREQASSFTVAMIGPKDTKPVLPDHKLMMVPLASYEEAGYLLSILCSSPIRLAVEAYAIATSTNTHVLEIINIKRYDNKNRYMRELSKQAKHNLQQESFDETIIDDLVAKLFNITAEEMQDIRWNLADLEAAGRGAEAGTVEEEE